MNNNNHLLNTNKNMRLLKQLDVYTWLCVCNHNNCTLNKHYRIANYRTSTNSHTAIIAPPYTRRMVGPRRLTTPTRSCACGFVFHCLLMLLLLQHYYCSYVRNYYISVFITCLLQLQLLLFYISFRFVACLYSLFLLPFASLIIAYHQRNVVWAK